MRERQPIPIEALRLARLQAGVLSREQALGLGVTRRVVDRLLVDGTWARLDRAVYLVPGIEPTWAGRVWGGILLGGPESRAAGLTAARLDLLCDDEQLPIDILTPFGSKPRAGEWVRFRQERPGIRPVSSIAQPPRTRVADTVLDLCAVGSESTCIHWVTTAVQRNLVTPDALRRALARRRRQPHRQLLSEIIGDAASGVQSNLEHRYRHDVERAHGLPNGTRQASPPQRAEFVDVAYREFGLIVELDGRIGHLGRHRDRRRDNANVRVGAASLRYGWFEVSGDPCGVAVEVAEMLVGRGWSGYPIRCPNCLA